ncbi:hypothetical protein A9Q89_07100 [Gammaproteobacteria bacterium 53_120_T64]|nr:hypothetical protein A9Q89_07100 [Gammaproteobacteria bacterium 53_120_T64]
MGKNIMICCDGTNNEFKDNLTNVVITYQLAEKSDRQMCYYDPGVGTGRWEYNEDGGSLKSVSDAATGTGLQKNIEQAYEFLMNNFVKGDKVYLFGFSRGAFTVRALAGMLNKVGLLGPEHKNLVEYAYKIYTPNQDEDDVVRNKALAKDFKATFSRKCPVHFIGAWDTVQATAVAAFGEFDHCEMTPETTHGRQALAIDEIRDDFPPTPWNESALKTSQTCEQLWFSGVHSDVGGGYNNRKLANIPLRWMLLQASEKGLHIDVEKLLDASKYPTDPNAFQHDSHRGMWIIRGSTERNIAKLMQGKKVNFHDSVKTRLDSYAATKAAIKKARKSDDNIDKAYKYEPDNLPAVSKRIYVPDVLPDLI